VTEVTHDLIKYRTGC